MVLVPIECLHCGSTDVIRYGQTSNEKQRFLCRNDGCGKTFIQDYSDKGRLPEIKQRIMIWQLMVVGFVIPLGCWVSVQIR